MESVQVRFSTVIQRPGKLPYSGVTAVPPNHFNKEMRKIQLLTKVGG